MRGKDMSERSRDVTSGITPAHAGKRCSARTPTFRTWDHPRACGEKVFLLFLGCRYSGSPPRMRGKDDLKRKQHTNKGITPAHAGKSKINNEKVDRNEDHPRACGEKHTAQQATGCALGSPPRMRGKGGRDHPFPHHPGITPAHAGKRRSSMLGCAASGDHPRACGEKVHKVACLHVIQGSPPRMRGKE